MSKIDINRLLRIATMLALVALALIVWSLLDPTPIPVIVSMSVGQAIGTVSFGMYLFVVFVDQRRAARRRRSTGQQQAVREPEAK